MEIFETNRLLIRNLLETDFDDFYGLESDSEVFIYLDHPPFTSIEEVHKELQNLMARYERMDNDFWVWACIRREDLSFVGTGAIILNEEGHYEIGYRLLKKYWGRGYAKELGAGLIRHGFEKMHLQQIKAVACEKNTASIRLLNHCMIRERIEFNPNFNDMDHFFVLDRMEWERRQTNSLPKR